MTASTIKDNLLVSAVNGGGVLLVSPDGVERWSRVDTTGIALLPGGVALLATQAEGRAEIRRLGEGTVHRVQLVDRSLDLHDLWADGERLLAVATQINTVFEFDHAFKEIRHWAQPGHPDSQHLNSVCVHRGECLASRFGAFFEHRGYKGRTADAGSVLNLSTGSTLIEGLSQPHSLLPVGDDLWLCNSEASEVRRYRHGKCVQTIVLDGYTRGLAAVGGTLYVGLSRSRNATGGDALPSACIVALDLRTGRERMRVALPVDEVYAIQPLPDALREPLRDAAFADALAEYDSQVAERHKAVALASSASGATAFATRLHEANLRIGELEARLDELLGEDGDGERREQADGRLIEEQRRWIALVEEEVAALRAAGAGREEAINRLLATLADAREAHDDLVATSRQFHETLEAALEALRERGEEALALRAVVEALRASRRWRWSGWLLRAKDAPLPPSADVGAVSQGVPEVESARFPPPPSLPAIAPVAPAPRARIGVPGLAFAEHASPLVSILVPAWGGFGRTLACLESIVAARETVPLEVILVEDASGEADMDRFGHVPGLRYRRNATNLGFLRSVNAALDLVRGEYLCLLNNDTRVAPGWLSALLQVPRMFHDFGAAGSRLLGTDGTLQEAGAVVWSDGDAWNVGRGDEAQASRYQTLREVDYVSAASVLLRADVFRDLGGFDERYAPAYYEDTDLSFRLRERGLKTYYQPASVVAHDEGGSHGVDTGSGGKALQPLNRAKFVERWGEDLARTQMPPGLHPFLAMRRAQLRRTVLVVDRHVPHTDRDAGSRAIWHFMRALQVAGCDVLFWSATTKPDPRYRMLLTSHGIEYLDSDVVESGFKAWLQAHGAYLDDVVLSRPEVAETYIDALRACARARIVLYGHDIHYMRMRGERDLASDTSADAAIERMVAREHKLWLRSDVVLYPSDDESNHVREFLSASGGHAHAATMPLFGLPPRPTPVVAAHARSGLLFVGGFAHAPNRDAMVWFHKQVWPLLRKGHPDLVLRVIGTDADEELLALAGDGIEFLGAVDDGMLDRCYEQACAAIVPLRFGAGVKGKVLEAMHQGLPCVTTSVGAQGLPDADALCVADDAPGFAREVSRLLEDGTWWEDVARRGVAYVERHHSVAALARVVDSIFGPTNYPDVATRLSTIESRIASIGAGDPPMADVPSGADGGDMVQDR